MRVSWLVDVLNMVFNSGDFRVMLLCLQKTESPSFITSVMAKVISCFWHELRGKMNSSLPFRQADLEFSLPAQV